MNTEKPKKQARSQGREGVRLGIEAEQRFRSIMETHKRRGQWPLWLSRIQDAIYEEDISGIDFWAAIHLTEEQEDKIPLQIKRSDKQRKRSQKKYPHRAENEQPILYIIVNPEDTDETIFDTTIRALEKERERLMAVVP